MSTDLYSLVPIYSLNRILDTDSHLCWRCRNPMPAAACRPDLRHFRLWRTASPGWRILWKRHVWHHDFLPEIERKGKHARHGGRTIRINYDCGFGEQISDFGIFDEPVQSDNVFIVGYVVSAFSCYYQLVFVVEDFLVVRLYQQINTFVVIYSAENRM